MDFDCIENLNEEQILELYQEIIETPTDMLTWGTLSWR